MIKDKSGRPLSARGAFSKIIRRLYAYLADLALFGLHLGVQVPSHHFRRLLMRLSGAEIGKGSAVHMGCRFFSLKNLKIGDDSVIGYSCFVDGRSKVVIGSHVDIASEVMIYNSEHDVHSEDFTAREEAVIIEDYVFIGPRVIILPGVTIGRGAVVAAGAVVAKDIAAGTIVGGVPAEVIGTRKIKAYRYKLGRARLFQ